VDLERRCPIDLLPDRETTTVAQWLRAHPGIRVISRDRAGAYAHGARQGAPSARQVADRWHRLTNLITAGERFLSRHQAVLRQAAQAVLAQPQAPVAPQAATDERAPRPTGAPASASRERRLIRYAEIRGLALQGQSQRAIARDLRLHRQTVRRFATAEQFPERATRPHAGAVLPPSSLLYSTAGKPVAITRPRCGVSCASRAFAAVISPSAILSSPGAWRSLLRVDVSMVPQAPRRCCPSQCRRRGRPSGGCSATW
jgi:transposase